MAEFTVNARRFDPYKNFKFRVKWDGKYVAGISKVSSLKRTTEAVEHRDGADPSHSRKSPGKTKYDPVTLDRGVTVTRVQVQAKTAPAGCTTNAVVRLTDGTIGRVEFNSLADPAGGDVDNLSFTAVPEPATLVLLGTGILGGLRKLRKRS